MKVADIQKTRRRGDSHEATISWQLFDKEGLLTLHRAHTVVSWRLNPSKYDYFGHHKIDNAKNQWSGWMAAVCVGDI